MTRQASVVALSLFMLGCAESADDPVAAAMPSTTAAEASSASPAEPDAYYEYLWCRQGENYSAESGAKLVADWNAVIDGLDAQPRAAFAYLPDGWEDPNFDGLWVLNWEDAEAMAAGWAAFAAADGDERVNGQNPGVLSCGAEPGVDRFGWTSYVPKDIPVSFNIDAPPYYLTNQLCTYKEGKSGADLRAVVRDHFLPAVLSIAESNPDSSYWFRVEAPDFTPLEAYPTDFNWVNFWKDRDEGLASQAAFAESAAGAEIQMMLNEVASCAPAEPQGWAGYALRTADGAVAAR